MADMRDGIYRSLRFDSDEVDFSQWPKLSCSAANELTLATKDDPNPGFARLAIAGELKLQAGVAVNELSSDEKLTNNSDLAIPTQKAVKTYVDNQIAVVNQSLSVKAALAGASSQDFESKNLSVSGNLTIAGNVGIGTTAPTEKLEVAGKIKATELEASGTVKAAAFRGDGSALTGKVSTTGDTITGSLTIQNALTVNGKVGIGTTTPEGALDVKASDSSDPSWITGVSIRARKDVGSVEFRATWDGFLFNTGDPAGANALYIRQDGNIGIGTTNPTYKLEVAGDVKVSSIHSKPKVFSFKVDGDFDKFYPVVFYDENWGDGPTQLEINRPYLHTDSTWRGALNSRFNFHSSWWGNGANFCRTEIYNYGNQFIAGYENYYFTGRFVIWLRGGGTTYFWRANSLVLLEDYSPKEKIIKVNNDDRTTVIYPVKTNIDPYVLYNGISFDQNFVVQGSVGIGTAKPAYKLDVAGEVHASSFPTSSDARLKTNITSLTNVLEKLEKIRGVMFEWNEVYEALGRSTGHREIGVTAQEVEAVFPELVTTWGDEGYKAVDYGRLTGVLIEAAKELKAENEALKQRIEALERVREKK
jgi:hypothetical protein